MNSFILIQKQSLFDELGINSILNTRSNENFLHKMKRTDKEKVYSPHLMQDSPCKPLSQGRFNPVQPI